MKRTLVHLALGGSLAFAALQASAAAQDGPVLPGFESTPPVAQDELLPALENETQALPETQSFTAPDDIRPLDDHGRPQAGPPAEGVLDLPEPPSLDAPQDEGEGPSKSLWQKSTDALRNLTKPAERKATEALRNWQMRRAPATSGPSKPEPQTQPQLPPPPAIGVEAKATPAQLPSSRRTAQAHSGKAPPQARAPQPQAPPKPVVQPTYEADNTPRSPWERPMRILPSRNSKYRAAPPRSS